MRFRNPAVGPWRLIGIAASLLAIITMLAITRFAGRVAPPKRISPEAQLRPTAADRVADVAEQQAAPPAEEAEPADQAVEPAAEIVEASLPNDRRISAGDWLNITDETNSDSRILSVLDEGRGQLILTLSGVSALVIGANKVVIETSWEIEGDYVTFVMNRGEPDISFQRLMLLKLEKSTRFHINEWTSDSLILERVKDGEVFQWRRLANAANSTE